MRIVAGSLKGRNLQAPPGSRTRPTSDRVREAIFSIVGSLDGVAGTAVVDLFAGSGALGIEALSRGAASVTFVEQDRDAVATIRTNLAHLGLGGPQARLELGDALAHLATAADAAIVFADPPYGFEHWADLGAGLLGKGFGGLAVLESGTDIDLGGRWDVMRVKRYGGTVVTVAKPDSGPRMRGAR
ncbi:MAG: 16S rRNA (guanine(966)-N(2))-methyltransferase RsmD [Actinomycetota bacterium]|nr:16S rRNA (guanine(966)-N(2))-methyltransferase RsmD [Actinomycetota bacterium]